MHNAAEDTEHYGQTGSRPALPLPERTALPERAARRGLAALLPTHGRAFIAVHAITLAGVLWTGLSWKTTAWALVQYLVVMFGVTAGFHRYFSHRAFKTSRAFQLVLAVLAQLSAQRSVIWWAGHHRHHHRYSDRPEDVHSPLQRGLWHAHMGWLLTEEAEVEHGNVKDLERLPELRFLDRWRLLPATVLGVSSWLLMGWQGLFAGFFLSLVLSWHATFTINSLTHVWGRRRFDTGDDSRNSFLLALLTLGEGWHNNHHRYMGAARQGFAWYELDISYVVLRLLAAAGLIWELREPPAALLEQARQG